MTVVTRFAPSPTGLLHPGNLRTALFNWLVARKAGGAFILRLDDTDADRSRPEFADAIREDLTWLGLAWDREERQSARLDRYAAAAETLKAQGRLYPCWETPEELDRRRKLQRMRGAPPVYDRAALALDDARKAELAAERPPHWRFRLDRERISWEDGILGPQSIDAASLSDPVLIREDGQFLYTLCSVADDIEMGVTDVVRGADHVTNTATQIEIIRALGAEPPRFAHHALLTGPGGEALSKRLGGLSLRGLRARGVEPMALLSQLARIGSSGPVELRAAPADLAEGFSLSDFGAAPTTFDPAETMALTARAVRAMPPEEAAPRLAALGVTEGPEFWLAVRGNLDVLADAAHWAAVVRDGAAPDIAEEDRAFVAEALALLPPRPWDAGTWKAWTEAVKAATGRKGRALYQPLRKALTGRASGPDMAALMPLMRGPTPQV